MNKTQQGRSMIEMLGVLAIVGVLSVGGIMAYNMAMNKFKTNKQMDQIQLIMTNVKTLFASNSNYSGLSNGVLVALGVLTAHNTNAQSNATSSNVPVDNAFGGNIYVYNNSAEDADYKLGKALKDGSYIIAIDRIPRSACAVMANNDWGGSDSGLLDLLIDKSGNKDVQSGTAPSGDSIYTSEGGAVTRINVAQLANRCQSNNNAMFWVIK